MTDFYLGQGDLPLWSETMLDANGAPVNIQGASLAMTMIPISGGANVITGATVNDDDGTAPLRGKIHHQFVSGESGAPGDYLVNVVATNGGKPITFPNTGYLLFSVLAHAPATAPMLSANALITVNDARAWLRRSRATGYSAADDVALLTLAINGVSEAVINVSGREPFDPTGTNADLARTLEYDGSGFLNLSPYDLRAITSITLGGQTLTLTDGMGGGDYIPMPRNKNRWGTYDYLTLRSFFRIGGSNLLSAPVLRKRDIVITGKWGLSYSGGPKIPNEMYLATLIGVDDMYRNPGQDETRGAGEFQIVEAPRQPGASGLPEGALEQLAPLMRMLA